jgi:lipopolysaccharide transport protein LptA/LPS export ABC transporter protein LptC
MNRQRVVYIAIAFIVGIIFLSGYFFLQKPERATSNVKEEGKRVIVFKDIKYSGEKKGVIDWEIRADIMRKFIDSTMVEMEGIKGLYKPKPDTTVTFTGRKGSMDTAREVGSVQGVEVFYKGEYVIRSPSMEFDFQKSLAYTKAPVDVEGKKFAMKGIGLNANTKDQIITVEKDVSGNIQEEKGKYAFTADRFTYLLRDNTYIFEGNVVVKGEKMDMYCDRVQVLSQQDDIEKIDAAGNVKIVSRGTIAKSERAVYYLREDKVVLTDHPRITRDKVDMVGDTIVYDLTSDKFSVQEPKMKIEPRAR